MSNASDFVIENRILKKYVGPGGSVTIPEGVTVIAESAFKDCQELTEVILNNGVTEIQKEAFYHTGIEKVIIPDSVCNIGENAFVYCKQGKYAWEKIDGYAEMKLSKKSPHYRTDGKSLLMRNDDGTDTLVLCFKKGITFYDIPQGVSVINSNAFIYCTRLRGVSLPNSLKIICDDAFQNTNISTLDLPAGVVSIGNTPFLSYTASKYGKRELIKLNIDPENQHYFEEAGCLYENSTDGDTVLLCFETPDKKSVTIKEGTTVIGKRAFAGSKLTTIALPESVREIHTDAFRECKFKALEIPEGVVSIASGAFDFCNQLKEVILPSSLQEIFPEAFDEKCKIMLSPNHPHLTMIDGIIYDKNVTVPKYVTKEASKKICVIPDTVTSIGTVFAGISAKKLVLGNGIKEIQKGAFIKSMIPVIEIPASVTSIDDHAFTSRDDLAYGSEPDEYYIKVVVTSGSFAETHMSKLVKAPVNLVSMIKKEDEKDKSLSDWSFIIENGEVTILHYFGTDQEVDIPFSIKGTPVTEIGIEAFSGIDTINSIIVPDTVKRISQESFTFCRSLSKIVLPDSLQIIGSGIFGYCSKLTNVIIPDGVKEIKEETFFGCDSLTSITIPDSVISIDEHWLSSYTGEFGMNMGQKKWRETRTDTPLTVNVKTGSYAESFVRDYVDNYQKSGEVIKYLNIIVETAGEETNSADDSATSLNRKVLDAYFSYEKVTDDDVRFYHAVPDTIKISGIKSPDRNGVVTIPETIDGLPVTFYSALGYYGSPIKKLIVPKTLVTLTSTEYFPEIEGELVIDEENSKWSTDGVSLLSKDGTKLLRMCRKNQASYSIPDGVTTICFNAFKFNNIVELTIPDSVTTVEGSAFAYCSSLTTVNGGKNIVNFELSSFNDTDWYKSSPVLVLGTTLLRFDSMEENVVVPDGIEIIGPKAFSSSGGKNVIMETVKLPSTVREIGEYAFSNKKNLKTINFPEGLQTIKNDAFYGCRSLTEIILPESISEIGVEAFSGCSSLTRIKIPHAVSGNKVDTFGHKEAEPGVLSAGLFSGCTSLESFTIPDGTVMVGEKAFKDCQMLKNIQIPISVIEIGKESFANCFELESVKLPAACVDIGQGVFPHSCYGWTAKTAKFSRIDVDPKNEAFSSVDGILCSKSKDTIIACPCQYNAVEYVMPEGIKEILPKAFEGCENIKKVVFAQSVKKIGERAFASMKALEEIVLPSDFTALGKGLFEECSNLKYITWPNNVLEIGEKCFTNTGIENLLIPETVESIGDYAFSSIKAKRVTLPQSVKSIGLSIFARVPEIEVYDTIDSQAKPAAEYIDEMNGGYNGKVGFIGIYQKGGYLTGACNATWYEHNITVRSSEDDSIKYSVRMPDSQKRKVYCTYASSWGKNAEFNFTAIDNIFKDLTADAKFDYLFNRLHHPEGISDEMTETLKKYAARNAKDIAARIFKSDSVDDLILLEPFGIVKKKAIDELIEEASKAEAMQCSAWLLDWQNSNLSTKEKDAKSENRLSTGKLTVAEIKKIWPNKKGKDGGLTITGYNGKDIDVVVPEIIGKTPVTVIGEWCFSNNKDNDQQEFLRTQLRSVEIPDSVITIDSFAFNGCTALETVKLPKKLKVFSSGLFCGCKNLSIEIPNGITEIRNIALVGCSMKTIKIPSSVKTIGENTFGYRIGFPPYGTPNLESINVDSASKFFKSIDGVLFSKDGKTLVRYPQAKSSSTYEIPDGVETIAKNAFAYADALKSVTIPESVDDIEEDAFFKCTDLQTVKMPEIISTFGSVFARCSSLTEISVPQGVIELPNGCFAGCKLLTKVSLPKGLKKIGGSSFADCECLTEINIPGTVRGIGGSAFDGCRSLRKITISKTATGLGWRIFEGCGELTIHTPAGSKMYTYAKDAGIPVVELIED